MGTPRRTPEYEKESVRQMTKRGYSVAEVSNRLGGIIAPPLNATASSSTGRLPGLLARL